MDDERIWWDAYLAVLLRKGENDEAREVAEQAVLDYRERWGDES